MSAVYKYPVQLGEQEVDMPASSQILSAIVQNGVICIYTLVPDTAEPMTARKIIIAGTGWRFKGEKRFISTVQDGQFVWHVFEA